MLSIIKNLVGKPVRIETDNGKEIIGTITDLTNDNNRFVVKVQKHATSDPYNESQFTGKFTTKWIVADKIISVEEDYGVNEVCIVELDKDGQPIPHADQTKPAFDEPIKSGMVMCCNCAGCYYFGEPHTCIGYPRAPYIDLTWPNALPSNYYWPYNNWPYNNSSIPSNAWYLSNSTNLNPNTTIDVRGGPGPTNYTTTITTI